jgi:shikimate kinase
MIVVQRSIAGGYAALVGARGHLAPARFATPDPGCQTGTMQHIVLVGLMGSGKTTVGTLVAGRLGWPLRDSDADIAAREGRTVREIRDALGTRTIHDLEAAHLRDALADPEPSVVCAAASIIDDPGCRDALQASSALVIWLTATPATGAARFDDQVHRPRYGADPETFLERQAADRGRLFRSVSAAELATDLRAPAELADLVLELAGDPHEQS